MADEFVTTTSRGWGSRLGGSIKGILVGFLMVAGGVYLLFWNEGRAVKRAKALAEGASTVVSVDASAPRPGSDGKLVHFSGEAWADGQLRDRQFGVSASALKLVREVEMYQWQEDQERKERKKLGGGTETVTTYRYNKGWSANPNNSANFHEPSGHGNPAFPFNGQSWSADPVQIGDWTLSPRFVAMLSRKQSLQVGRDELNRVEARWQPKLQLDGGGFFHGDDPGTPKVGDLRIRFSVVKPDVVSVVGRQQGQTLVPYQAKVGGDIALLTYGTVAADAMFQAAKRGNTVLTWILRLAGFVILMIAFNVIFKPLSVLADVVPLFGNLVGMGTGLVATVLAALLSLVVIALGWVFYRPLLGIALLLAAAGLLYWLVKNLRTKDDKWIGQTAPPPPPPPAPGS